MSRELRTAYKDISSSYLKRKIVPWKDLVLFLDSLNLKEFSVILDVGSGNGRNIGVIQGTIRIAFDLSYELLLGYCGPDDGQKVAGAGPNFPFRRNSIDIILAIAVIHHGRTDQIRLQFIKQMNSLLKENSEVIISVWRKWRPEMRFKILEKIKNKQNYQDLVDHNRPWKDEKSRTISTRFYHYYTFKELYFQLLESNFIIEKYQFLGGKSRKDNIFVYCKNLQKTR
ncbi:MAG: class I SAM-dependent methyltransferase [Candidatus Heimdallarchaeota archaeon]|nr:class I SAM-dependent methyltransferase [Candidatus Heimdallarchaeota archaeon]MDH5647221.1 class I SAM-dependent methyltransferase [Candidatus Heimdallarchaeota archaeon]